MCISSNMQGSINRLISCLLPKALGVGHCDGALAARSEEAALQVALRLGARE